MSAREELISLLRTTMDEKDAAEVADAYRAEVLHEAAGIIAQYRISAAGTVAAWNREVVRAMTNDNPEAPMALRGLEWAIQDELANWLRDTR